MPRACKIDRQAGQEIPKLRAFVTKKRWFDVLRRAFEGNGVEFIDENGGGPGVRLRKCQRPKQSTWPLG